MIRWHRLAVLAVVCALVGGCAKKVNDQDDVRASIEKHLNGRSDLNLGVMNREYKQISVSGDHATAQVGFRLKDSGGGMDIEYSLERRGKEWAVLSSRPLGMDDAHSGREAPSAGGSDSGGMKLPPGHPQ